ncbi:RNA ligase A [Myxococcus phage Mx1]|nr:RNA ligase A [Myxococcus phage Mx1]
MRYRALSFLITRYLSGMDESCFLCGDADCGGDVILGVYCCGGCLKLGGEAHIEGRLQGRYEGMGVYEAIVLQDQKRLDQRRIQGHGEEN